MPDKNGQIRVRIIENIDAISAAQWDAWAKRANVDPWNGARRLPWGDDARPEGPPVR